MFQDKEDLIQELKRLKEQLQSVWPIESLALFGSWVRGNESPSSDVDLLIQFRPGAESDKIGALEFVEIQLRLQDALGCKVDLVEKSALIPILIRNVVCVCGVAVVLGSARSSVYAYVPALLAPCIRYTLFLIRMGMKPRLAKYILPEAIEL